MPLKRGTDTLTQFDIELPTASNGKQLLVDPAGELEAGRATRRAQASANDLEKVWKERTFRLLGQMNNPRAKKDVQPFLKEGEHLLVAMALEVAQHAGGEVGPIAMNALCNAAWQSAYGRYWMHLATLDPTNLKLVETASKLQDAALRNSTKAMELAVALAKSKRDPKTDDPLAAYDTPAEPAPPKETP